MSTSLDKLRAAMESASPSKGEKKSYSDDRFWKPELDKSGNGFAIIPVSYTHLTLPTKA